MGLVNATAQYRLTNGNVDRGDFGGDAVGGSQSVRTESRRARHTSAARSSTLFDSDDLGNAVSRMRNDHIMGIFRAWPGRIKFAGQYCGYVTGGVGSGDRGSVVGRSRVGQDAPARVADHGHLGIGIDISDRGCRLGMAIYLNELY